MVHRTKTHDDTENAIFMETYTTQLITRNDKIRLEVWDYDDWRGGADDLMLSAELSANQPKPSVQNPAGNLMLETSIMWKPEIIRTE